MSNVKMDANSIYSSVENNESKSEIKVDADTVNLIADDISLAKNSKGKKSSN